MSSIQTCSSYACYDSSWLISSAVSLGVFALQLLVHISLAIKYKTSFCSIIIIATALETLGYGLEVGSVSQGNNDGGLFIAWQIPMIIAPFLINVYIYTLLSRLHSHFTPHTPLLRIGHILLPILSIFDITPFVLQIIGSITVHGHASTTNKGTIILFAGFILQLPTLLTFLAILVSFHRKANAACRSGAISLRKSASTYMGLLHALYWSTAFLLLRVVGYIYNAGTDTSWIPSSSPQSGKWTRWEFKYLKAFHMTFDTVPVVFVVIILAWAHPGRFLKMSDQRQGSALGVWMKWRAWRSGRAEQHQLDTELVVQEDVRRARIVRAGTIA